MTNDLFGRKIALSIRQPWAELIVRGVKDIENRTWRTHYRGPVLIHASLKYEHDISDAARDYCDRLRNNGVLFACGGIIGVAEIVDCVTSYPSPWFEGPFGFVLANARPLPFRPLSGRLNLFEVDY